MSDDLRDHSLCTEYTYRQIYERYGQQIYRFLIYKGAGEALAADLMQDAFVKLWENCEQVSDQNARAFLYTVANRLFLNVVKKQKVRLKYEQSTRKKVQHETPEFLIEEKEFRQRLESAIQNLSEKQREVFLMSRIDQMKYREIADALNISVKAVEKRMSSALFALKEILNPKSG